MFKYQNSSFRVKNLILLEAIRHLHISHSAPYLPPVPPPPNFASPLFFISPGSDYSHPKRNRPLSISKNPDFQNEARCTTFLVKMSFICMRMMISIAKAEHLPSFWNRGQGELGNGLLKTYAIEKFWGQTRCIMGDAQVAYRLMLAGCKFNKLCFQNSTTVERTNKDE